MTWPLRLDTRVRLPLLVAAATTVIYAVALTMIGRLGRLAHPDLVAAGVTIDLAIVVPAVYYVSLVRTSAAPLWTVVPVAFTSLVAATLIVPAQHHGMVRALETLAAMAEVALVAWVIRRAVQAWRTGALTVDGDVLEGLTGMVTRATGRPRLAQMVGFELSLLYYALVSWRVPPSAPMGTAITQHRRSAHGLLVVALLHALVVEGLVLHLLLTRWSTVAAWLVTASEFYVALWAVADYRAARLSPTTVDATHLSARAGLRWRLRVPLREVAATAATAPPSEVRCLNLAFPAMPTVWLRFAQPQVATGPYGIRRCVGAIAVAPDVPEVLAACLASATPSAQPRG